MNTRKLRMAALVLAIGVSGTAQAALHDRGGGLIYDDVLNVTWLADANYGAGSSYDNGGNSTNGTMTWTNAVAWAANLSYYDNVRNVTYTDWRLPTVVNTGPPDCNSSSITNCGYNVQTVTISGSSVTVYSEMAYMYYVNLDNQDWFDTRYLIWQPSGMVDNPADPNDESLFTNLMRSEYWSGSDIAQDTRQAWYFDMSWGYQNSSFKDADRRAWAVRDGDVAAIPEPETFAMMLTGLGLVGAVARRRNRSES